jgi:hypothetical protein
MRYNLQIGLIALCLALPGCSSQSHSDHGIPDAEMIFWEHQSWEVGGGRSRLTIWADGRSEVMVVPDATLRHKPEILVVREGWTMKKEGEGLYFVRRDVFQRQVAKEKFNRALAAGIHQLKTFRPDYVDGSGTLVGIQIDGAVKETVIPMFLDRNMGSANHKRFLAVSDLLSYSDRRAYDIKN